MRRRALAGVLSDLIGVSKEIVIYRSTDDQVYVIAQDRRLNGKPFDRVGIAGTLEEAAAQCWDRWDRATPPQRRENPED